ncbi:hypothetical protein ANCDUO_20623 [Ancylostoma duodenale]|uniref:Uncharacterized protein n=1 Tax=Ancylostoma duodenale TaxID=51022 RepID=A0A0C2BZD1_9BILA|nr:hypothetical protein ANCDUO_20623 [Ancylostoma duodenale]
MLSMFLHRTTLAFERDKWKDCWRPLDIPEDQRRGVKVIKMNPNTNRLSMREAVDRKINEYQSPVITRTK